MTKKGWLVVNGFLTKEKFDTLYAFLSSAASVVGLQLEKKCNTDLSALDFSKTALSDFVLFWDKDVALARRLEKTGVPLFNSASAIEICDSKILTALCLEGKVAHPKTLIAPKTFEGVGYTDLDFVDAAASTLGLPFVIKEEYGSFGAQVYLVNTVHEAKEIVKGLGHTGFVMQQFIAESRGRDVRVNVVGGKVNSAMVRTNNVDFRSNITGGGTATAYTPTDAQAQAAIAACQAIGLDFAGVDILFGK
ncbi:MAG: RimK family alpha-L-glutamate ligase, partial [Clostridia bacterium]|nr:RimK family alpha-L-glutamate ligase [Clostridia bacterium]